MGGVGVSAVGGINHKHLYNETSKSGTGKPTHVLRTCYLENNLRKNNHLTSLKLEFKKKKIKNTIQQK